MNPQSSLSQITSQVLYPLVQAAETKDPKIVKVCMSIMLPWFATECMYEVLVVCSVNCKSLVLLKHEGKWRKEMQGELNKSSGMFRIVVVVCLFLLDFLHNYYGLCMNDFLEMLVWKYLDGYINFAAVSNLDAATDSSRCRRYQQWRACSGNTMDADGSWDWGAQSLTDCDSASHNQCCHSGSNSCQGMIVFFNVISFSFAECTLLN